MQAFDGNNFNGQSCTAELEYKKRKKLARRKKLLWDAVNMKITNFDEANQFVKREYRNGWEPKWA